MEVVIFFIAGFVFLTLVFAVIAVFAPEWVGITGQKAKEYEASHQETTKPAPTPPET